jgi:glycolate oxidase
MGRTDLKNKIAAIVGRRNVSDSRAELRKNASDAAGIPGKPILVAYPQNKFQIIEIVRLANALKVGIVARGGGSGLSGGATAKGTLVLNLTKMNMFAINKGRKYAVAEPGVLLDDLNRELDKHGLLFPVQPASHDVATIGGMVSTNAGGEQVLRYGKMADNILGLEAVRGDGRLVSARGTRIGHFCGTEGIMGIVVEAKLRIIARPAKKTITVRRAGDAASLLGLVGDFVKNKNIIACEFINPKLYSMIRRESGYFLLAEFEGEGGEISGLRAAKYWRMREGCYHTLWRKGWRVITDPEIPRRGIREFLGWCEAQGVPAFGHIGHGIIHVHFRNRRKMDSMYRLVRKLGGQISGEHGIGILKREYLPASRRRKLKKLKRLYDPNNILNRGKVI